MGMRSRHLQWLACMVRALPLYMVQSGSHLALRVYVWLVRVLWENTSIVWVRIWNADRPITTTIPAAQATHWQLVSSAAASAIHIVCIVVWCASWFGQVCSSLHLHHQNSLLVWTTCGDQSWPACHNVCGRCEHASYAWRGRQAWLVSFNCAAPTAWFMWKVLFQ